MLLLQFPIWIINTIKHHNTASLPGVFSGLLTIIAMIIIYLNNLKIDRYQERVHEQAVTDRLTGLANRFACSEYTGKLVADGIKFSIVSADLNNFKNINDTMGHAVGNEILVRIASRWKNASQAGMTGTGVFAARLGGDEFSLIIKDYDNEAELLKTINYYKELLENRITIDDCDYYLTASFGYAEYPSDASLDDTLFTYADAAMYEIKRINGMEHIMHFRPDLLGTEHALEIEREIRNAIENDSIYFNLQPQFDLSHKLRGFEALARMKDSNGNNISPGEFIPIAEKIGLVDRIDAIVFSKAAAFIGREIKETGADITLSINASVRHLMKNDFLEELNDILKASDLPASNLEVEVTESVMLDPENKALSCIHRIKDMGVKIAIDDFGTGYSSLSYLNKVPANLLKIDKSFIDDLSLGESAMQYVAAIIAIGHIMNMEVISEGVETKEQLETLATIDCDYIQGFIWGCPMLPEEAAQLIRSEYHRNRNTGYAV